MFLNYRNYAETTIVGAITAEQTEITLFQADAMPDVPFLLYATAGLTLAELQTAERRMAMYFP